MPYPSDGVLGTASVLIGWSFCPPIYERGMRLQVLQVIRPTRLCLVNTTVPRGPLLLSLRGLPKTPLTTSSRVRRLLLLHVGI